MFKVMSKGAWVVVGVFLLYGGLFAWTYERDFLHGNVWSEHRVEKADPVQQKVDFLGLQVASLVNRSLGAVLTCLLVAFVYLAVQLKRVEHRLINLEARTAGEKPG